jgi:hypothetical protein
VFIEYGTDFDKVAGSCLSQRAVGKAEMRWVDEAAILKPDWNESVFVVLSFELSSFVCIGK